MPFVTRDPTMSEKTKVSQEKEPGVRKGRRHRFTKKNEIKERRKETAGSGDMGRITWPMTLPQLRVTQGNPTSQGLAGPQGVEAQQQPENNCGHLRGQDFQSEGGKCRAHARAQQPLPRLGGHFHLPQVSAPHNTGQPWPFPDRLDPAGNRGQIRAHSES